MNSPQPRKFALSPRSAMLMQQGAKAHEQGDLERAEACYRELTAIQPDFPDAWHYLGLLIHQRGGGDEALAPLNRARDLDPDNFIFLLNFGRILREQYDLIGSLACLDEAHQLRPEEAPPLVGLAQTLLALNRGDDIVPELEARLSQATHSWHLWCLLGQCRDQGGDHEGATQAFTEAVRLAPPDEIEPHLRLAECGRKTARYDMARKELELVLRLAPDTATAYYGLANLEALEGNFPECERLARHALNLEPRLYMAWQLLASTRERNIDRDFAEELEAAAVEAGSHPSASPLNFARGKAWERLKEYDRAFAAYQSANQAISRTHSYSPETQIIRVRNLMDRLDSDFMKRHRAISSRDRGASPCPIFICGMPRSGTTLVETILASHPQVYPGGEMRYITDLFKRALGNMRLYDVGNFLGDADSKALLGIAAGWDQALTDAANGHAYVTDKMPSNFNQMALLETLFPAAPIIYMKRDARDNCFSCYTTNFSEGHYFSNEQESLAHYYRLHEIIVQHWKDLLGPDRIIEVRYEELVRDPENQVRRLLEAVGLPWDPRCLDFHKTQRTVMTASLYQVRQPMYDSSVGRWRHFERHLAPLLESLNKTPDI